MCAGCWSLGGAAPSVSAPGLFQTVAHEGGKQRHHHLGVHFHQILRLRVNTGTDLAGQ